MSKFKVDKDAIRELAALLEETGLSEIEIEDDDKRLRVSRASAPAPAPAAPAPPPPAAAGEAGGGPENWTTHAGAVTSPMVGTAYVAPEPDAAPFVQVGDEVAEGQTLLIVEAMKTMNPIPAPWAGKITRILVENAAPVEFGEVLMVIE
jgi:acetyl-CoA carboxylase biotin carboxyl carrier protein